MPTSRSRFAVLVALVLAGASLAGCLNLGQEPLSGAAVPRPPLSEAVFDTTGSWSETLAPGAFERLAPAIELVPSFDGTEMSVGIFRPDIPGCPTGETDVYPEECKVPVIIDAGPYYTPTSVGVESTRPPIAIWFVPHGYAVVQMAVRGTGGSGGCMELMSMNEQMDVDAIVTAMAEKPWSTGNVGMMGRSYDGTTPFMAAALGNPHLKTIVPISGVADLPALMFRNGTSEFRGPIFHNVVYWATFGVGAEPVESASSQACPEVAKGTLVPAYTTATGDTSAAGLDDYWQVRQFRERILENYVGSLYVVHGMQDWNVNPSQTLPWFNDLQSSGLKVKGWFGQWEHHYPDRPDEHINVRWDWAETLLRWFDSELKGMDVDTGPVVEVEDHRGTWHTFSSWPPREATFVPFHVNADGLAPEPGSGGPAVVADPLSLVKDSVGSVSLGVAGASLAFQSEPLAAAHHVAGLPQLHLTISPSSATGSVLHADLYDVYPDGRVAWIGQAVMNTNYCAGGTAFVPHAPGQEIPCLMEFEPLDAFLPEGHSLRLVLSHEAPSDGRADSLPRPAGGPVTVWLGEASVLRVPAIVG